MQWYVSVIVSRIVGGNIATRKGKSTFRAGRFGSEGESACLLRHTYFSQPSAALRSVWVGHLLRKAVRQPELPSSRPTSSLQVAVALCDVARIRISFTCTPPVLPSTCCFSVFLTDPRDYKAQRILAWFLRKNPSTNVIIQSTLIVQIEASPRQELRSGISHWQSSRQTLRRLVGREE